MFHVKQFDVSRETFDDIMKTLSATVKSLLLFLGVDDDSPSQELQETREAEKLSILMVTPPKAFRQQTDFQRALQSTKGGSLEVARVEAPSTDLFDCIGNADVFRRRALVRADRSFGRGESLTMAEWPIYLRARDLGGSVFPVSEEVILSAARKHGIGRKLGRAIIFSVEDCYRLYEVLPCPSRSSGDPIRPLDHARHHPPECKLKKARALLARAFAEEVRAGEAEIITQSVHGRSAGC